MATTTSTSTTPQRELTRKELINNHISTLKKSFDMILSFQRDVKKPNECIVLEDGTKINQAYITKLSKVFKEELAEFRTLGARVKQTPPENGTANSRSHKTPLKVLRPDGLNFVRAVAADQVGWGNSEYEASDGSLVGLGDSMKDVLSLVLSKGYTNQSMMTALLSYYFNLYDKREVNGKDKKIVIDVNDSSDRHLVPFIVRLKVNAEERAKNGGKKIPVREMSNEECKEALNRFLVNGRLETSQTITMGLSSLMLTKPSDEEVASLGESNKSAIEQSLSDVMKRISQANNSLKSSKDKITKELESASKK